MLLQLQLKLQVSLTPQVMYTDCLTLSSEWPRIVCGLPSWFTSWTVYRIFKHASFQFSF